MGGEIAMETFQGDSGGREQVRSVPVGHADGLSASAISPITRMKGVGLVVAQEKAADYAKYGDTLGAVKLKFKDYSPDGKNGIIKRIEALEKDFQNIVLSYLPEKSVSQVLKSKHKSDVCIEFEYGYSEKR